MGMIMSSDLPDFDNGIFYTSSRLKMQKLLKLHFSAKINPYESLHQGLSSRATPAAQGNPCCAGLQGFEP